jgi:sortase A
LFFTFAPVIKEEIKYTTNNITQQVVKSRESDFGDIMYSDRSEQFNPEPPNTQFSIVIPKIQAKAPLIANTNPFSEEEFLPVLRRGVAHAEGTVLPGNMGNTYIFAHSTDAFYNVGRYNAVFYLIGKLKKDDEVYVYYNDEKYIYKVYDSKVVPAESVEYLNKIGPGNTLTLQTCYPPGTTLKRLVVLGELVEKESI